VAQATDSSGEVQVGQTNLQLDTDMLPMNSSQNDSADLSDIARDVEPEAVSMASFDVPAAEEGREIFVMPVEKQAITSPGARLRAAREAKSMDLEQAANRLRLPQRLLQALEADDYSRIEHGVYLRGYLVSYARLLGLPASDFARSVDTQRETPTLVATGKISHSRYLYERYSVPAVYVLLTGLIVGPSVWLATHGGLEHNLTRFAPLDTPAETTTTTPAVTTSVSPHPVAPAPVTSTEPPSSDALAEAASIPPVEEPSVSAAKPSDQPLMASLAPFPAMPVAPPVTKPVDAAVAPGFHRLHLKLSESSWVEIIGDDGRKLEFGLLPAGSERDYSSNSALSVRLGNATGAVVVVDGKSLDLAPYRRSNVAYFRAFGPKSDVAPVEN